VPKPPANTPERGDRVKLRGKASTGELLTIEPERLWAHVKWDESGPKYVHLHELEKLPEIVADPCRVEPPITIMSRLHHDDLAWSLDLADANIPHLNLPDSFPT
jgi:hypothetical protein